MPAVAKDQFCDNCGEFVDHYAHNRSLDGPVICGAVECERAAAAEEREERAEARYRADRDGDGYGGLYGGGTGRGW